MSVLQGDARTLPADTARDPRGPVTAARQRRTLLVYLAACALGLVPLVLGAPAGWQAAGLGLWAPGAGFVAAGGWYALLFPVTLAVFLLAVVAWFWCGMVVAPAAVWLGAAALAGAVAGEGILAGSHLAVGVLLVGATLWMRRRGATQQRELEARAEHRRAFLPAALAEVEARSTGRPEAAGRELTPDQIAALRYVLDRALQPVDRFDGFDVIDQFQPAALRYQLNHMGFALGIAQGAYLPNFQGYLRTAQRNLIDKYLLRRVWDYWVYESCWGHFNFRNWDPARKDNIMLTGWFGMHVGQYMLNSGDRSHAEPGALTFRLNARTAYPHDLHSLIGSVVDNYTRDEAEFCLYPCEPNWIYPICNHYGMTSLAVHDRLFGTKYVERFLPTWLAKLDSEFTDASGSIIGLRSQLTGIRFPFPVGEAGYAHFAHCFAPERARRLWAIARRELEPALGPGADGRLRLHFPGKGLDAGHYRPGFTAAYSGLLIAAREFGDEEIAAAAQHSLDADCGLAMDGGVRRYLGGSNLANANAVMGALMGTGDFRRSFVEGPAESTRKGPVLAEASYPEVLVARAFSDGEDLDLVVYPGRTGGRQTLEFAGLQPGRSYGVCGAVVDRLVADAAGRACCEVELVGRTAVSLEPA